MCDKKENIEKKETEETENLTEITEEELVFKTEALKSLKLSDNELNMLLDMLESKYNNNLFTFISVILKDNIFKFLDLFEGQELTIPTYKELVKLVDDSKFFVFYNDFKEKNKDLSNEELIKKIASVYTKSPIFIERKLKRINTLFEPKATKKTRAKKKV